MRYVQINTFSNGSTGAIMLKKHRELLVEEVDSHVFWRRGRKAVGEGEHRFGVMAGVYADGVLTRLDGRAGFHSGFATAQLLRKLDKIDPDVVHLHNVHGYYVNVEMLFEWLAARRCQVKWTLHDCWAFTGHCAHFTYVGCDQWKRRCGAEVACPQLDAYPKTVSKRSCARNFDDKKRIFNLVPADRMELVTPSQWLADLVGGSFLSKYPVTVRRNEIDRTVFKPTPSDFRERYGVGERFMVLGVASPWIERKGLSDFARLAHELDSSRFAIVLVGLDDRQIGALPKGVIGIKCTDSPKELAAIYTAADVYFNPTHEDNYPTVNLEAEACGTPVVTYDVGGCAETIGCALSKAVDGYSTASACIEQLAYCRPKFDTAGVEQYSDVMAGIAQDVENACSGERRGL